MKARRVRAIVAAGAAVTAATGSCATLPRTNRVAVAAGSDASVAAGGRLPTAKHALRVRSVPAGAQIRLTDPSGRAWDGRTPASRSLYEGPVTVELTRPGYNPVRRDVDLVKNRNLTIWLDPAGLLLTSERRWRTGPAPKQVAYTRTARSCGSRCSAATASRSSTRRPDPSWNRSSSVPMVRSRSSSPRTAGARTPARWRPRPSTRSIPAATGCAARSTATAHGARCSRCPRTSAPCTWPTGSATTSPRSIWGRERCAGSSRPWTPRAGYTRPRTGNGSTSPVTATARSRSSTWTRIGRRCCCAPAVRCGTWSVTPPARRCTPATWPRRWFSRSTPPPTRSAGWPTSTGTRTRSTCPRTAECCTCRAVAATARTTTCQARSGARSSWWTPTAASCSTRSSAATRPPVSMYPRTEPGWPSPTSSTTWSAPTRSRTTPRWPAGRAAGSRPTTPPCGSEPPGLLSADLPGQPRADPGRAVRLLLPGIALLGPDLADLVVAALLPETAPVVVQVLDAAHPLGALPRVQMRHHQPQRESVLGAQRLGVAPAGQDRVGGKEVGQPEVGAVPVLRPHHHVGGIRRRRDPFDDLGGGHSLPMTAGQAELGHAVQVGGDGNSG